MISNSSDSPDAARKAPVRDKPLPSPPIAQIMTASPTKEARGLIDASERPLRRSPPDKAEHAEEWPALSPEKTATPTALEETNLYREQQSNHDIAALSLLDRSPSLGSPLLSLPSFEPPLADDSPEIARAQPADNRSSHQSSDVTNTAAEKQNVLPTLEVVEKPYEKTKDSLHPHHTKESTLRARLSGSQSFKELSLGSKVIDFAVPKSDTEGYISSTRSPLHSINGRRPPAKNVAGSRLPVHYTSSRGSLRGDSSILNTSSRFGLPPRPVPDLATQNEDEPILAASTQEIENVKKAEPRRSSIPVFRRTVSSLVEEASSTSDIVPTYLGRKQLNSNERFEIFEDSPGSVTSSYESINDTSMQDVIGVAKQCSSRSIKALSKGGYKIKRLSLTSPDLGPTLKISHSAERVIMGTESNKENAPQLKAGGAGDLRHAAVTRELRKQTKIGSSTFHEMKQPYRPLLSQNPLQAHSRVGVLNSEAREMKAKGNGVGYRIPVEHLRERSGNLNLKRSVLSQESLGLAMSDDPFFDAHSRIENAKFVDVKLEDNSKQGTLAASEALIITPQRLVGPTSGTESSKFPPRNSSRAAAIDYTLNNSAKASPVSPLDAGKNFSRDFTTRQNNLGGSIGLASSPVIASKDTNVAKQVSKRDSIAQESNKSRRSVSKGVLSNFRGLFNKGVKECGDQTSFTKSSKNANRNFNAVRNASPFPCISDIHPAHRPALAYSPAASMVAKSVQIDVPPTPSFHSPAPSELSATTALAMRIIDSARNESSNPKKEHLLELGSVMVGAITQAREAEKAMEEAKQAARKAEVAYLLCKTSVADITKIVQAWKGEISA